MVVFFMMYANGLKFMPNICSNDGRINNNIIIAIIPFFSAFKYFFILGLSDHPSSILEPSRGGMGSILNIAKRILKNIIFNQNNAIIPLKVLRATISDIFNKIADMHANIILVTMPAEATRIMFRFLVFNAL